MNVRLGELIKLNEEIAKIRGSLLREGYLKITYLEEFKTITNNLLVVEEVINREGLNLNKRIEGLKRRIEQNLNFVASLSLVSGEEEDKIRVEGSLRTSANELIKLLT